MGKPWFGSVYPYVVYNEQPNIIGFTNLTIQAVSWISNGINTNTIINGDVHIMGAITIDESSKIGKYILEKFPGRVPTEDGTVKLLERLDNLEKFLNRLGISV